MINNLLVLIFNFSLIIFILIYLNLQLIFLDFIHQLKDILIIININYMDILYMVENVILIQDNIQMSTLFS